jgi:hypothetical protein
MGLTTIIYQTQSIHGHHVSFLLPPRLPQVPSIGRPVKKGEKFNPGELEHSTYCSTRHTAFLGLAAAELEYPKGPEVSKVVCVQWE